MITSSIKSNIFDCFDHFKYVSICIQLYFDYIDYELAVAIFINCINYILIVSKMLCGIWWIDHLLKELFGTVFFCWKSHPGHWNSRPDTAINVRPRWTISHWKINCRKLIGQVWGPLGYPHNHMLLVFPGSLPSSSQITLGMTLFRMLNNYSNGQKIVPHSVLLGWFPPPKYLLILVSPYPFSGVFFKHFLPLFNGGKRLKNSIERKIFFDCFLISHLK